MTAPKYQTREMRAAETIRQAELGKLPVYLSRQDWRRLWVHLGGRTDHLPITTRLLDAIEDAIMPTATETATKEKGQ